MYLSCKITYFTLICIIIIIGLRSYEAINILINKKNYIIIVNFFTLPILFLFLLFPIQFLISNLCLPFLSKDYLTTNSKYYSCNIIKKKLKQLPSITIQIPLYDEDFKKVLRPMLRTCIIVRNGYIRKGGKCNIIVNDDGIFKFINDDITKIRECDEIIERIKYYKKYNIAFTARKFKNRKGRFKKASNMNFCFNLSKNKSYSAFNKHFEMKPLKQNISLSLKMKKRKIYPKHKRASSTPTINNEFLGHKINLPRIINNKKNLTIDITVIECKENKNISTISYPPSPTSPTYPPSPTYPFSIISPLTPLNYISEQKIPSDSVSPLSKSLKSLKPLKPLKIEDVKINDISTISPFTFSSSKNKKAEKKSLDHIISILTPNKIKTPSVKNKNINFNLNNENLLKNVYLNKKEIFMMYGDIEIKNYILLIDSDSVIPTGFLENVVKEFEANPMLAYTQNYTIPLYSSYQNYFSKFISHFTINLNEIIFRVSTRNGDISPLIGHNIMIRKKALENISDNNVYWSEDRVSEDFDLCLRFTNAGYYGKFIAYKNKVFQEGVSLSFRDEMNKYSKFAYGASEIIFNPIKDWCKKGVLTDSFYNFIKYSNAPFTSKIGILGYLMTYFSIASAIIVTPIILIVSCYLEHWELLFFDIFYAFLFLSVLFSIINPVVSYIVKKKLENETISTITQKQYIPNVSFFREIMSSIFFCIFYSSISFPIFTGVSSHLLNLNISWGSTVKNLKSEKWYIIFLKIIKEEKKQFLVMIFNGGLLFNIYYLECKNIYVISSLLSLIIGHLLAPFLLTPTLFGLSNYVYDTKDTPTPKNKFIFSLSPKFFRSSKSNKNGLFGIIT